MKKTTSILLLAAFLSCLVMDQALAGSPYPDTGRKVSLPYVVADLVLLRPFGLAMTVTGAAMLVATSPITGIASIAPPHDAFQIAAKAMVTGPAGFTFDRPLGEMSYNGNWTYPVRGSTADRPIQPSVSVSPRKAPAPATPTPASSQKP